MQRACIAVQGLVQGVGFRPFVYQLARTAGLKGFVRNTVQGVVIEVEGESHAIDKFLTQLNGEAPALSSIESIETSFRLPCGYDDFTISRSESCGERRALILPDMATCMSCRDDIFNTQNRRYQYPFTNCTQCGPRYSIIKSLPYDRAHTTMRSFRMCAACRDEYEDPQSRRFHAQANACPACGPHLALWDDQGRVTAQRSDALCVTLEALRDGKVVAVKGLGGFHLMVLAGDDAAIRRLRRRKQRDAKPFALMFPSLASVEAVCVVSPLEAELIRSTEAPIVLLEKKANACGLPVAPSVASANPYHGILLPYTPLHHLIMAELDQPVVATSGNISNEPLCIQEREAVERLRGIADLFLVHDRPIERAVDDSIARIMLGHRQILRRARGYAPLPVPCPASGAAVLAVGAHLKNSIVVSSGEKTFVSPHIGDLESEHAYRHFYRTVSDLQTCYDIKPKIIVHDAHPDYLSTQYAQAQGLPHLAVQHHYAHVLSCMADNELSPPLLGVAWDGSGYGSDGTLWGGEFLRIDDRSFTRAAHVRTFMLPGGTAAVRQPWRSACGLLYELGDEGPLHQFIQRVKGNLPAPSLKKMMQQGINAPRTSSMGRLFDAVAAVLGLCHEMSFEGQAAMTLEALATGTESDVPYAFEIIQEGDRLILDWAPMILELLVDVERKRFYPSIASKFHRTLACMIVAIAEEVGERIVVLTGGCFQNKLLTEMVVPMLIQAGFEPYWHRKIPPNDGGIAVGQAVAASRMTVEGER